MVFDPYAPPPEQPVEPYPPGPYPGAPPYQGYPPQYGWQPYPYAAPARSNRSRDLLVGGGIALSGLALLAFVWLLANGGRVTSVFVDDPVTSRDAISHVEIPSGEHGPAFKLVVPPEWYLVPTVPDTTYRARVESADARFAIGSTRVSVDEPLELALDLAARDAGEEVDRDVVPRTGLVAGHRALMARLVDDDPGTDVWFAVFHAKGARWFARYTEPYSDSPLVPVGFTRVLGGWRP